LIYFASLIVQNVAFSQRILVNLVIMATR